MKKCRRRFSSSEKKEILDYARKETITKAAQVFNVSTRSIHLWLDPEAKKRDNERRSNNEKNKQKNRERSKRAYHKDKEKHSKRAKASRQRRRFKRLADMSNRFFEREEWLQAIDLWRIAKKQRLVCALTGDKLTKENISVDHIIPKSKGGSNKPENIRLVCKDANLARRALSDEEFILMCEKVVKHLGKENPRLLGRGESL